MEEYSISGSQEFFTNLPIRGARDAFEAVP